MERLIERHTSTVDDCGCCQSSTPATDVCLGLVRALLHRNQLDCEQLTILLLALGERDIKVIEVKKT